MFYAIDFMPIGNTRTPKLLQMISYRNSCLHLLATPGCCFFRGIIHFPSSKCGELETQMASIDNLKQLIVSGMLNESLMNR